MKFSHFIIFILVLKQNKISFWVNVLSKEFWELVPIKSQWSVDFICFFMEYYDSKARGWNFYVTEETFKVC